MSDASNGISWTLPSPRSEAALQLHIALTSITPPTILDEDDSYCWKVYGTLCNGYSSSQTREAIRPRETARSWAPIVWYKGAVPKQAFTMWLATLNRLPTRTRLASWGMNITRACCLCNCSDETREHLFLNCRFSLQIWAQAFARLSPHQPAFFTGT